MSDTLYDVVIHIIVPTLVGDLYVPVGLLVVILLTEMITGRRPPNFASALKRIAIAWVISLAWRAQLIKELRNHFAGFDLWFSANIPNSLGRCFLIISTILHFYVLLSLVVLLCRLFWSPSIPLLRTRAYPSMLVSALFTFALALYLRLSITSWHETFLPLWYFYFGAALVGSLALISRSDKTQTVPVEEALAALARRAENFVLRIFAVSEIKPSQEIYQPAPEPTSTLPVVFEPAGQSGPARTAHLKLRRSQRTSGLRGRVLFALDARMEVPAEDQSLIAKYALGDALVYDSANRQRYTESAKAHLDATRNDTSLFASPGAQLLGAGKSLFNLGRASVSAAMAGLSLRITIHSLIAGVHVECKSMQELLEAEEAIVTAAQNLKSYLETAATFDGRENIIELR